MRYQPSYNRSQSTQQSQNNLSARLTRRLSLQLVTALLLLGLWMTADALSPEAASRWGRRINVLLGQSWDVTTAFSQLGEQLQQGEDPLASVGDWCVSVFLPQEISLTDGSDC